MWSPLPSVPTVLYLVVASQESGILLNTSFIVYSDFLCIIVINYNLETLYEKINYIINILTFNNYEDIHIDKI